jgi:gluconate 2-dehydrogenase alpha chain
VATRLQPVDAVTIGVGLTSALAAYEIVQSGLKVVGFERGAARATVPDFQSPSIHDELRYSIRKAFMQDSAKVAVTFRNDSNETALPIRRWESFLPGQKNGGHVIIYLDSPNLIMSRSQATLRPMMPESYRGDVMPAYVEV